MNLNFTRFNWLKRRSTQVSSLIPEDSSSSTLPSSSTPKLQTDAAQSNPSLVPPVAPLSDELRWIDNDGLLRDEGVLFGMSGGDIVAKLAVIDHYYARQIQHAERKCSLALERLTTARTVVANHVEEMKMRRKEWEELQSKLILSPHDFFRSSLGTVVYAGMISFVYFLLYDWLKPFWPRHTELVVAGIYAFGMLSLFRKMSFFYTGPANSEQEMNEEEMPTIPSWKILLEEVGAPVVTALLAVVWGWDTHTAAQSMAMFLFLLFAFLFPGKAFLSSIVKVTSSLRVIRANRMLRQWRRKRIAELKETFEQDKVKLQAYTAEADQLEASRDNLPDPEQIRLLSKAKQELFSSEYVLAKESRKTLTLDEALTLSAIQDN